MTNPKPGLEATICSYLFLGYVDLLKVGESVTIKLGVGYRDSES